RHRDSARGPPGPRRRPLPRQDRHLPAAVRPAADERRRPRRRSRDRTPARRRRLVDDRRRAVPLRPLPQIRRRDVIVTITPNPSIDRTLSVPGLRRGEIVRVTTTRSEAGGKGINVSCALARMGVPTVAIAPASRASRAQLAALLASEPGSPVELRTVPIEGEVRVNVSIVEPDGTVPKVNEPGPTIEAGDADRLL